MLESDLADAVCTAGVDVLAAVRQDIHKYIRRPYCSYRCGNEKSLSVLATMDEGDILVTKNLSCAVSPETVPIELARLG